MRLIFPSSVREGKRYRVIHRFASGTVVMYEGVALKDGYDDFVSFRNATHINAHSYVGCDCEVWEV